MSSSKSSHIANALSPDIYALSGLIKDQFDQFSRGDAILVYADGQIRYVHRYDCVTYHFVDQNTARPRCIVTCIAYTDDESIEPGNAPIFTIYPFRYLNLDSL
ncbi:hypothetical protein DFH28DRAFT_921559 [Melampsora americana]|nr:hypothetical protein DFH28DRAFT_921559 [Melampsora americana]